MRDISDEFKEVKNVTVYVNEKTRILVILGQLNDDDEGHDCDYMGCGMLLHVLYVGRIDK